MSSHAKLSPSSAERWLNCPPSALINAEAPRQDTVYTREGTIAHELAELKTRRHFRESMGPRKYNPAHKRIETELAELAAEYPGDKDKISSIREMDAHTDAHLELLKDIYAGFTSEPYVVVEQLVSFDQWVSDGFGTADCIMIGDDTLHIVDFKYGKGVAVGAEWNPQMMLYAAGALASYDLIYDIKDVCMHISQPRLSAELSTWQISADELREWCDSTVAPAAKLAAAGEGEFREGPWCRWCAIKATCRARANQFLELEQHQQALPPTLTDDEVGNVLKRGAQLAQWLDALNEYALSACLRGVKIPGFKAVEGRSIRVWTDAESAFDAARKAGVDDEMLYERKPVTLAGLEKLMGKGPFFDALHDYIVSPPGKPTLVPDTDKRPAMVALDVKTDFGEYKED